ncbi:MAG: hypothetical protein FJ091_13795 [Deltaproteobacteria bacterium]|nr:hypothetical protein [Deltaproteobacteria bacterium]
MRNVPALLLLSALCLAPPALAKSDEPDPRYQPTQSLLEVNAVLRRHISDDTYRFAPARDFTGRNVYRSSLLRLENLERAHEASLRAGAWAEVLPFAKGRALERLRAYDVAAESYRRAAAAEGELAQEALRSAAVCDALVTATKRGEAPPAVGSDDALLAAREARIEEIGARRTKLEELLETAQGTHYAAVVREEIERNDRERARVLVSTRRLFADGAVRALAALQRLAIDHKESKLANSHVLELAELYATLAREYVEEYPPESPGFEPERFEELVNSAARLYETVSNQDGATEKLEAARRLEAFLAFTLKVDRDRFTP